MIFIAASLIAQSGATASFDIIWPLPPPPPTPAGFLAFLRGTAGIPSTSLPASAQIIPGSLTVALDTVNLTLAQASPQIYTLAVYNLATDRLINFAMDQPNQNFFSDLRQKWKISSISSGVVSGSSDDGTSVTLLNPEQFQNLTLADLQTMKTPFGRQYMAFAQTYGPTLWGLT